MAYRKARNRRIRHMGMALLLLDSEDGMPLRQQQKVILNFICVYLVWGSTYLAIKYAILGFPPFLMASLRFLAASGVLLLLSRLRGESWLGRGEIRTAALSGTLLVLGNALVCFSEISLPSGLVAVVVGTMPVWITLFNWRFFGGARPLGRQVFGIVLSLLGIVFLTRVGSGEMKQGDLLSWLALSLSVTFWAFGTLIQRGASRKTSIFAFSGVQMGVGGLLVLAGWALSGGLSRFHAGEITTTSVSALLYLVVFGSVLGFTCYLWLNRNVDPTIVSTYALVNPVVAVWLGWLFVGEEVSLSTLSFSILILTGLYFVISPKESLWARYLKPRVQLARHRP